MMNLVIIALCLILFWGTIHMFRQLNDAFSRPAKTNWMENNVQSENYAYLVVNYHEDMVYGGLLSGTKKECYGVARYFEAASMYKAFLQAEDTERAAREKEKINAHMKKWVTGRCSGTGQGETLDWTDRLFVSGYRRLLAACRQCRECGSVSIPYFVQLKRGAVVTNLICLMASLDFVVDSRDVLLDRCCDGCLYNAGRDKAVRERSCCRKGIGKRIFSF